MKYKWSLFVSVTVIAICIAGRVTQPKPPPQWVQDWLAEQNPVDTNEIWKHTTITTNR